MALTVSTGSKHGCKSDSMRLHSEDAFTRPRWLGGLKFQGPGPNAPQALQSRGLGWGADWAA